MSSQVLRDSLSGLLRYPEIILEISNQLQDQTTMIQAIGDNLQLLPTTLDGMIQPLTNHDRSLPHSTNFRPKFLFDSYLTSPPGLSVSHYHHS